MSNDSENFASRTVGFQSAAAKFARRVEAESGTGDIDFAGDSAAQPAFLFMASRAAYVHHFANEFVAGRSAEIVVAAEDFDVGVADAREAHADESPAAAEGWQWFADGGEGLVFCDEGEHGGLLLTKKFQISNGGNGKGKSVRRYRSARQLREAFAGPPRQAGAWESGGEPPHSIWAVPSAEQSMDAGLRWILKDSLACCDEGCGEGGFFVGEDGAEVEDEAIVFDTRNDGRAACGFA